MSKLRLKQAFLPTVLIVLLFVMLKKCSFHSLPNERLSVVQVEIDESYADDEYQLILKNTMSCPMRFLLSCQDVEVNELLSAITPVLLEAKTDTSINIKGKGDLKGKIEIRVKWGNPELPILSNKIERLPYPKGKSYKLLQGNNSKPTHNSRLSRYAFDFTLNTGDTITSSQNGYVVAVVDGYKGWGKSAKWKPFGNQIIIYDTLSHLFTIML